MVMATVWYQQHAEFRKILSDTKAAGLWAWKRLVFLEALKTAQQGDYVMWHDAARSQYRFWNRFNRNLPLEEFAAHIEKNCGGALCGAFDLSSAPMDQKRLLD